MARVVVSTDGYVADDGRAGWAFVADTTEGEVVRRGVATGVPSHLAEWLAMQGALAWAEGTLHEGDVLELRTDSALVAKGLARRAPAISGDAGVIRAGCRQALARLGERRIRSVVRRVGREENLRADAEARQAVASRDTPA